MKNKFLLVIHAGTMIDDTAKFYYVRCQNGGEQAKRDVRYIMEYSAKRQFCCMEWGEKVYDFVRKLELYMLHETNAGGIHWRVCTAREYVRAMKTSTDIPVSIHSERNSDHTLQLTDPNYFVYRRLSNQLK